ncbi:MAG: hypothetical protein ABL959_10380 [Pyrinomonadaceae bacterium]
MFNLKAKFMLAAALLFLGGVSAANAQLVNGSTINVAVSSPFVLRDKTFDAGVYTIERTPSTIDSPSLLILRGEGETMVFDTILGRSEVAVDNTQLVFETIGGTNYLSAIVVKGNTTKNEIARSKAQARAIADGVSVSQTVMIANTGF